MSPQYTNVDIEPALENLRQNEIIPRIWAHDHTVWKPDPAEITNRLGWLKIYQAMQDEIPRLEAFAAALRDEGYTHALLLGMGGSSLAPEVFSRTFKSPDGLRLSVLDSTDPGAVLAAAAAHNPAHTLYIVATKSGSTAETLSFFKYFYNQAATALGEEQAGAHFIAITDPSSRLIAIAEQHHFRATFLNDPNIGGRYSALSFFGLLPAALVGVDLRRLLSRASAVAAACGPDAPIEANPAAVLGALLGHLALAGRDKVTFVTSPAIADFPNWVEQLIAESTGKEGRGILPVVGEPPGAPEVYGDDRVFVHLRLGDDETHTAALAALEAAGHPVLSFQLEDTYDLGGQFFLWELATAVAGYFLGINPFDQPNVESAKILARQMVKTYLESGALPRSQSLPPNQEALDSFVAGALTPGGYIAFQAYLHPTAEAESLLKRIRLAARQRFKAATTLGFGPRFLHSTGQLHKGDAGHGVFIQLVSDPAQDTPIPDQAGKPAAGMSFNTLKKAQALGDAQALREAGRAVLTFNLGRDPLDGLRALLP